MAGLSMSVPEIITIMRNVTGRNDVDDPQFTDGIMYNYLLDFLQQEHPQEVALFANHTWYEFDIDENTADPLFVRLSSPSGPSPADLNSHAGFVTINPPCYIGGFEVFWYQDPTQFYRIWPETTTYQATRPTYVLYYDNRLVFRAPPDTTYRVKIAAYAIPSTISITGIFQDRAYLARYFAYGASLDIFSDYGEMDRYNEVMVAYKRYKGQVLARTWRQMMNQRTTPTF